MVHFCFPQLILVSHNFFFLRHIPFLFILFFFNQMSFAHFFSLQCRCAQSYKEDEQYDDRVTQALLLAAGLVLGENYAIV